MADFRVELTITNTEDSRKKISSETTVGEENAERIYDTFAKLAGMIPVFTFDEIR